MGCTIGIEETASITVAAVCARMPRDDVPKRFAGLLDRVWAARGRTEVPAQPEPLRRDRRPVQPGAAAPAACASRPCSGGSAMSFRGAHGRGATTPRRSG